MATITLIPLVRREKRQNSAPKGEHKVVAIEDYRGVVLLPAHNRPNVTAPANWNSGPLSAA